MNKRGYFFVIDALLASVIIISSILLMTSFRTTQHNTMQVDAIVNDYLQLLFTMECKDLDNTFYDQMVYEGLITYENNTIIEQVGELVYYYHKEGDKLYLDNASGFIANITGPLLLDTYNINVTIDDGTNLELLYNLTSIPIEDARLVYGQKKVAISRIPEGGMYGPFTVEVKLWS